jgi:hypothetical protein
MLSLTTSSPSWIIRLNQLHVQLSCQSWNINPKTTYALFYDWNIKFTTDESADLDMALAKRREC